MRRRRLERTDAVPRTTENHIIIIRASRRFISKTDGEEETRKSQIRRGHRSWTSATIAANRMNLNSCHAVSNQFQSFDVTRFALLVKQGSFLI